MASIHIVPTHDLDYLAWRCRAWSPGWMPLGPWAGWLP